MRIKDAIEKNEVTKDDIANLRTVYNSKLDSIFYLIDDIERMEKELHNKYFHLKKLQTENKLLDLYIEELTNYGSNKDNKQKRKKDNITLQYLKRLSSLCQAIPSKHAAPAKIQTENRK